MSTIENNSDTIIVNHAIRVNVHLDEFESETDANDFAAQLTHVLRTRHGWNGIVRVTDNVNHFDGEAFSGDLPRNWNIESYEAIWT